jgi:adenylate kinase family enzyme
MHTLIYLTGEQGSGKSTLCGLMRKALEIEQSETPNPYLLKEIIAKNASFYEVIILTSQFKNKYIEAFIDKIAEENNILFYSINLTKSK